MGSRNVALATAALIQNVVRSVKYTTIDELLAVIRSIGKRLIDANPKELASGNIVRRIIRLIREEYRAAAAAHRSQPPSIPGTPGAGAYSPAMFNGPAHYFGAQSPGSAPGSGGITRQASLSNFVAMRHNKVQFERSATGAGSVLDLSQSTSALFATPPRVVQNMQRERQASSGGMDWDEAQARERDEFARQASKLKPVLIQAIDEVINELETTHEDVARGAREHIHSSEVILTLGHSGTVISFLKSAFRDRKFTVIVLESAPGFSGQLTAKELSEAGIPTFLVPDSSVHAVMPRVTKVILGAHSVSANGGLFALGGSLAATLAARTHAKPVVVTTGQFKFAPAWNLYHEYDAIDFQGPGPVIGYDHTGGGGGYENVEVTDPHYDYIRPELINLYATNV